MLNVKFTTSPFYIEVERVSMFEAYTTWKECATDVGREIIKRKLPHLHEWLEIHMPDATCSVDLYSEEESIPVWLVCRDEPAAVHFVLSWGDSLGTPRN